MPNTRTNRLRRYLPFASRTLAGIVLLLGAFALLQVLRATRAEPTLSQDAGQAPVVRTVEVRRVDIARPWTGYGTVRAMDAAQVGIQITGRVVERPRSIESGLAVERGDVLLRIEQADFQNRVDSLAALVSALEADVERLDVEAASLDEQLTLALEEAQIAEREYDRVLRAFDEQGAGTRTEVDQRLSSWRRAQREAAALDQRSRTIPSQRAALQANLTSRRAELRLAQQDLDRTTVVAPISGVLQSVELNTGDLAQPGTPVAMIVDLSRLEVPLALPVSALGDIAVGDPVEVSLETAGAHRWRGSVERIAPQADEQIRSIRVFVEVQQELVVSADGEIEAADGPLLRPGMFVVGRVTPQRPTEHLLVPRRAVVQGGVLVAENNSPTRARRVEVTTLFAFEGEPGGALTDERQWLAVAADLRPGERVLVSNLDDIEDGSPIRLESSQADVDGGRP
ncbi:MAG: efflux RND transporter periplasmic adaptor subunit [Phycisphaerales bacterium]|jgi:RND family efflux transporter MFP subunit